MLAKKKKKTKNIYIQMNEQKEADKSSGFVHPRVELWRETTRFQKLSGKPG